MDNIEPNINCNCDILNVEFKIRRDIEFYINKVCKDCIKIIDFNFDLQLLSNFEISLQFYEKQESINRIWLECSDNHNGLHFMLYSKKFKETMNDLNELECNVVLSIIQYELQKYYNKNPKEINISIKTEFNFRKKL